MARIRSIHPGLFTDEAFMSASMAARVLIVGLWTEAWDDGAFEWKPIVIKARIFPADAVDVSALLDELKELNVIMRAERGGKSYGLIRNFRKFQRPKSPNSSGVVTEADHSFIGVQAASFGSAPEPMGNHFGRVSEISPQMEDGGCRVEDVGGEKPKKDNHHHGAAAPRSSEYAFDGRVIKLKDADFQKWSRSYSNVDLPSALQSRDDWLAAEGTEAERLRWFISTSNWLAKKNEQAGSAKAGPPKSRITPLGVGG
jgi:hypothetical protein